MKIFSSRTSLKKIFSPFYLCPLFSLNMARYLISYNWTSRNFHNSPFLHFTRTRYSDIPIAERRGAKFWSSPIYPTSKMSVFQWHFRFHSNVSQEQTSENSIGSRHPGQFHRQVFCRYPNHKGYSWKMIKKHLSVKEKDPCRSEKQDSHRILRVERIRTGISGNLQQAIAISISCCLEILASLQKCNNAGPAQLLCLFNTVSINSVFYSPEIHSTFLMDRWFDFGI